jgi:predicted naringenin-chalcone synthase
MNRLSTLIAPKSTNKSAAKTSVALLGIGTAVPPALTQQQLADLALERCCFSPTHRAALQRMFLRCGVGSRGSVLAREASGTRDDPNAHEDADALAEIRAFYSSAQDSSHRGPGTAQRMRRYALEAPPLAQSAASAALAAAQISADAVAHLITVSCTGFVAPGLDGELIRRLDLRPDVRRLHIGFMGCHAAFNALAAARDSVLADPDAIVLVCCVELCTLHFTYDSDPQTLVAAALFADGAAATVVAGANHLNGSTGAHWQLRQTASRLVPQCADAMTWTVGDHGFQMTLSPEVPELIRRHVKPWCEKWLDEQNIAISEISNWAVHPGGPKILTAVEESLSLIPGALDCSRQILQDHGNMSSNTVLFILQALAAQNATGPCVAIGFGPGLMMEGMLLER